MKSWQHRGDVERVELYTRASLYLMIWLFPLVLLPDFLRTTRDHPGLLAAAVTGFVVLAAASTMTVRAALDLYPAEGPVPVLPVAGTVVLCVLAAGLATLAANDPAGAMLLVVSMMAAWSLGSFRDNRVAALGLAIAGAAPYLADFRLRMALAGLAVGLFFVATVRLSLWMLQVIIELDRAKGVQAALAVAEERLRFSRDVHDVLGRRLSTIAVQAELGSALATRGDERAAEKMLEVRSTAHLALREARELARGYRPVDLSQEIEGARALLRSADIDLHVDLSRLPQHWHEPAAWVVRESVTNVLRHSSASTMHIEYADSVLSLRNNGAALAAGAAGEVQVGTEGEAGSESRVGSEGSGLTGLRERLTPHGASLTTAEQDGWFEVRVHLPVPSKEKS